MKKLYSTLRGCVCAIALSLGLGASAEYTDVTATYLPGVDTEFNGPTYTWDKNTPGGNIDNNFSNGETVTVGGWSIKVPEQNAIGIAEYGTSVTLKGSGTVPAAGPNGSAGGGFVMATGWGTSVLPSAEVTLPAGKYKLISMVYNCGDKNGGTTKFGWVPDGASAVLSNVAYQNKVWQEELVEFTLLKETKGKIQLGYTAVSGTGSGAQAKPCYDYVKLMRDDVLPVAPNMLVNASFLKSGELWTNATKNGTTVFENNGVTINANGGDNIVCQPVNLKRGVSYTFAVNYKGGTEGQKHAFAGFWNWNGSNAAWPGNTEPYGDLAYAADWTTYTKVFAPNEDGTKSIVLAANNNASVQYTTPVLIETPAIALNLKGVEATEYQTGNKYDVAITNYADASIFKVTIDGSAAVSFTPYQTGDYTVKVYYKDMEVASKTVNVVAAGAVNLMSAWLQGQETNAAPKPEWYSYNEGTVYSDGSGNGWQIRDNTLDEKNSGEPYVILLRYNDNNSTWLYGYKVLVKAGYYYDFETCAKRNEKESTLNVWLASDFANLGKSADFRLAANFPAEHQKARFESYADGDAYVIFKYAHPEGNAITFSNFFSLYEGEEMTDAQVAASYNDAVADAKALLEANADIKGDARTALEGLTGATTRAAQLAVLAKPADLKAAYDAYNAVVKAYADAKAAIEAAKAADYSDAAATHLKAYNDAIAAAEAALKDTDITAVQTAVAAIPAAEKECIYSHALAEGVEGRETIAITNPNDNLTGWTASKMQTNQGQGPTIREYTETSKYFDTAGWGDNSWTSSQKQTVNVAAGQYRLAVLARGSGNLTKYEMTAGNDTETYATAELSKLGSEGQTFGRGWNVHYVDFEAGGDLTIAVAATASVQHEWASYTGFSLVKIADVNLHVGNVRFIDEGTAEGTLTATFTEIPEGAKVFYAIETPAAAEPAQFRAPAAADYKEATNGAVENVPAGSTFYHYTTRNGIQSGISVAKNVQNGDVTTGIESIEADDAEADAVYYNLNGVRVDADNLTPGVYVKLVNGKATKVIR